MGDFAEGLISAIAGGVQGGAGAVGDIYEGERKNKMRLETETQLAQATADIQEKKKKAELEFTEAQRRAGKAADFEQAGKDLPETLRRAGLIEAGKTDAEKAKWNDPEYRKARSTEEGITNPDRGAGLRAVQLESAQLTLEEQKAANKFTPGEKEALSGLRKSSEIIEAAIAKVDAEGGTASQTSLDKLAKLTESRMKLLEPHLPKTEAPPPKPEPTVKYDAQGRAWVKGVDGKPVLQSEVDAAKPKAGAAAGTIGERPDVPAIQASKYPSTAAGAAQAKADEATIRQKEFDVGKAKQSVAQFTMKLDKGIGDAGLAAFALQVEEKHPGTLTPWQLRQAKNLTTKTGAR